MSIHKRITVLMVDDDDDDWMLVKDAFEEGGFSCEFNLDLGHLKDGLELVEYLDDCTDGKGRKAPVPDLILLDLNMPRMDGREALRRIKSHPNCRSIPVIVFTTSGEQADVVQCYNCGGSSFIQKPQTYDSLRELVKAISNYWLCAVHLPNK